MTVKELKEKLNEFQDDIVVVISDDFSGYYVQFDNEDVKETTLYNRGKYYGSNPKVMGQNVIPTKCVIII